MSVLPKIMQIIIYYFILTSYKTTKQDQRKIYPEETKENSFHSAATLAKEFALQHRATTHLPAVGLQLSPKSSINHEAI